MKQKNVVYTLIIVLVLLALGINALRHEYRRGEDFNRHPQHLYFTKHARCRMDCRHITAEDINEIIESGIINYNKTNKNDQPCPTYAIQGTTHKGESLRVIFAQCYAETKVITCYNLKQDFECHCPGDENKHQ